ncbi:methyl-accepting chemotaxis protein, partial [Campylobacter gastrosuis]
MRSLRVKVALILMLIVFISIVSVGILNYQSAKNMYSNRVVNTELPTAISGVAASINGQIQRIITTAELLGANEFVIEWMKEGEPESKFDTFFKYQKSVETELGLFAIGMVSDVTLRYYAKDSVLKVMDKNAERDQWYFGLRNSPKRTVLNVDNDDNTGNVTLFVNSKIIKEGKFYGIAFTGVSLDGVVKLVTSQKLGKSGQFYMADDSGVLRIHKDKALRNKNLADFLGKDEAKILLDKNGAMIKNGGKIIVSHYISAMDWYLIAELDESDILSELNGLLYSTLIVIFICGLVTLIISLFLSKYLLSIILRLKSGLLSFFDFLNHKVNNAEPIAISSKDEFADMANIINENITNIKNNLAEERNFLNGVNLFVGQIKDGKFGSNLDVMTKNPLLNELKNALASLQTALKEAISLDGQDVLKLLESYKKSDFTARLDDNGLIASGVNQLGVEIANMLKDNLHKAEILEQKAKILNDSMKELTDGANSQANSLQESAAAVEQM